MASLTHSDDYYQQVLDILIPQGKLALIDDPKTFDIMPMNGTNNQFPCSTNMSVDHPISLYAATKRANELMAHAYSHLYNLPTTGLRFFTVYGPWGRPDMALFKFTKAILEMKPIDVYNNGDLSRDFTFVEDIVVKICCRCKPVMSIPPGLIPKICFR